MRRRSAAQTDVGQKREANEDFYAVVEDRGLYIVADGLGGHVAGRRASELGVHEFLNNLVIGVGELPADGMRRAFEASNLAILADAERNPEYRGMGTTLVALWIRDQQATLAHVGDSRAYVRRDGKLHPLTLDHSLVGEMIARRQLSESAARTHPHRHIITRAMGVATGAIPDVSALKVEPGDLFVLCSDGISAQLSEAALAEIIAEGGRDLQAAAAALIDEANRRGGDDNATVVLVEVEE